MQRILLVSTRSEPLHSFIQSLSSDPDVQLEQVSNRAEAINAVRNSSPQLVIIDSGLPDADSFGFIRELMTINAMVNTAAISPLTDEQFHDAGEGLGILCRLPVSPGKADAQDLLEKLREIL